MTDTIKKECIPKAEAEDEIQGESQEAPNPEEAEDEIQGESSPEAPNPEDAPSLDEVEEATCLSEHSSDVMEVGSTTFQVVDSDDGDDVMLVDAEEGEIQEQSDNEAKSGEDVKNRSASNESEDAGAEENEAENGEQEENVDLDEDGIASSKDADGVLSGNFKGHPYRHLLLNYKPSSSDLSYPPKFKVGLIDKTPCIVVDTKVCFEQLLKELMTQKEIAIAIKYNTTTYETRLCYVNVSTKKTNYMIDCLQLGESLSQLNDVFANPNIVKVIQNGKIMRQLQQQNLWLVKAFDLQLGFRKLNRRETYWGYIDEHFGIRCPLNQIQNLGYWHTRPLPETYRRHAIIYLHYMLHVYYHIKRQLIKTKRLVSTLELCNKRCGLMFRSERTWEHMYGYVRYLPANTVALLHKLDEWRQNLAKKKDRSVYMVLSNRDMMRLATSKPTRVVEILAIADSPHVENHVNDLQKIIKSCLKVIGPVDQKVVETSSTNSQDKKKTPGSNQKSPSAPKPKNKQQLGAPFKKTNSGQFGNQVGGAQLKKTHFGQFGNKDKGVPFKKTNSGQFGNQVGGTQFKKTNFGQFGIRDKNAPFNKSKVAKFGNQTGGAQFKKTNDGQSGNHDNGSQFKRRNYGQYGNKNDEAPFKKSKFGQFGHQNAGFTRHQQAGPSKNSRSNRVESRGNLQSPNNHAPFGKRSSTQWDAGPSPKRHKTWPWSNQQPWSRDEAPSSARPIDRPSTPPSYVIVSNKGETIHMDGANLLANLLGNARAESHNRPSPLNDPVNQISTLLNLGSALMNLSNLNTTGRNLVDHIAPRADHRNSKSYVENRGGYMGNDNNITESRDRRDYGAHSSAAPSRISYPEESLSRSYYRSSSPDTVSYVNASQNAKRGVFVPPQSSNAVLNSNYTSTRYTSPLMKEYHSKR